MPVERTAANANGNPRVSVPAVMPNEVKPPKCRLCVFIEPARISMAHGQMVQRNIAKPEGHQSTPLRFSFKSMHGTRFSLARRAGVEHTSEIIHSGRSWAVGKRCGSEEQAECACAALIAPPLPPKNGKINTTYGPDVTCL